MTVAAVLAVLLWPVAALAAYVLRLRALDTEADKGRAHELAMAEAHRARMAKDEADELRKAVETADGRLQRLESRLALSR